MGRVTDILTRARDSLNDAAIVRFTDARLLRVLDEAQKQLVLEAYLLRTKTAHRLIPGVAEYSLPSDCLALNRATHNGIDLPFISHEELDSLSSRDATYTSEDNDSWEEAEDKETLALVYDKLNPGKYKVYPIPTGEGSASLELESQNDTEPLYGCIITADGDTFSIDSVYGAVIRSITDLTTPTYTTDEYNVNPVIGDAYGFSVTLDDDPDDIILYYYQWPVAITATSDELEVDQIWDTALKHYIVGMALRDDKDTQNREVGNEELILYKAQVNQAKGLASNDFTKRRTHYNTLYNTGFHDSTNKIYTKSFSRS